MKKINTIFAAFAAVLVLPFAACTTGNSDLTVALKPAYLAGGFTAAESSAGAVTVSDNKFLPLSSYSDGVATLSWTYKAANDKWGNTTGTESFKVTLGAGWTVQWGDAALTLNGDYVALTQAPAGNITVSGLKDGNTYTISVKASGATVSAKIEGKAADPMYAVIDNNLQKMTVASATTQTYTFTTGTAQTSASFTVYDSTNMWSTGGTLTVGDAATAMTKGTSASMTATVIASTKYMITVDNTDAAALKVKIENVILTPGYVHGPFVDASWSGAPLSYTESGTGYKVAYYEFKATAAVQEFGITADSGWSTKYTAATGKLGDDYVETTLGGTYNNKFSDLTVGTSYKLCVKGTSDKVYVKVVNIQ